MQRIDGAAVSGSLPAPAALNAPGYFTEGNPGIGVPATVVTGDWLNAVQEELSALIVMEGGSLSKTNLAQIKGILERVKAIKGSGSGVVAGESTYWLRGQLAAGGSGNSFGNGASAAAHIASDNCANAGLSAACVGADDSAITGTDNLIGGSRFGFTDGDQNAILGAVGVQTTGNRCVALATGGPAFNNPDLLSGENTALIASSDPTGTHEQVVAGARSAVIACERGSTTGAGAVNQLVGASYLSSVHGSQGAALASRDAIVSGDNCAVIASVKSTLGSQIPQAGGDISAVIASAGCVTESGQQQLIGGSEHCGVSAFDAVLLGSKNCELAHDYNVGGGFDNGAAITLNGTNQNLSWRFDSALGNLYIDNNNNAGGADYAECFENLTIGAIPAGTILAREGRKVRIARTGDRMIGVVSVAPTMLGNCSPMAWAGKFERDEWGRRKTAPLAMVTWPRLLEERVRVTAAPIECIAWPAVPGVREAYAGPITTIAAPPVLANGEAIADGQIVIAGQAYNVPALARLYHNRPEVLFDGPVADTPKDLPADAKAVPYSVEVREAYRGREVDAPQTIPPDATRHEIESLIKTDEHKAGQEYKARADRPDEWTKVALLGQVPVKVSAEVVAGDDLTASDNGIGVPTRAPTPRGAQLEVLEVLVPFDPAVGYAIALCLVR